MLNNKATSPELSKECNHGDYGGLQSTTVNSSPLKFRFFVQINWHAKLRVHFNIGSQCSVCREIVWIEHGDKLTVIDCTNIFTQDALCKMQGVYQVWWFVYRCIYYGVTLGCKIRTADLLKKSFGK